MTDLGCGTGATAQTEKDVAPAPHLSGETLPPCKEEVFAGAGATSYCVDLLDRARAFLVPCGSCDYALEGFGCTCPPGDPRLVISDLVAEVERLQAQDGAK